MSALDDISIDLTIVLGSTHIPIRQLLHMSRGAMIPLDCGHDDPSVVYVNGKPVAEGQVTVNGDQMALEITSVLRRDGK